eukprot:356270_1
MKSQLSKKRRLNHMDERISHSHNRAHIMKNMHNGILDLCDEESEPEYETIRSSPQHPMLINDQQVDLWGISIGTYTHYWTHTHRSQPPKFVFNQHKPSFDIYVQSPTNHLHTITIDDTNVHNVIIPRDSGFFGANQTGFAQYLNVLFLDLRRSSTAYPSWLSMHYNPILRRQCPKKSYIMIVIDVEHFQTLAPILFSRD